MISQRELKSGESYAIDRKRLPQVFATDEKSGAKIVHLEQPKSRQ